MKNIRKFTAIILGLMGISSLTSCNKDATCECSVEDTPEITVYVDITGGKCKDLEGKVSYGSSSYDLINCKEQ
jgi:hypothetical protein